MDTHDVGRPLATVSATTEPQARLKVERVAVWESWWQVRGSTEAEALAFTLYKELGDDIYWWPWPRAAEHSGQAMD